jgi:hypothetical protein
MDGTTPPTMPSLKKTAYPLNLLLTTAAANVSMTKAVFHIGIRKMKKAVSLRQPLKEEQQPWA